MYEGGGRLVLQMRRPVHGGDDPAAASFKSGVVLTPAEAANVAATLLTAAGMEAAVPTPDDPQSAAEADWPAAARRRPRCRRPEVEARPQDRGCGMSKRDSNLARLQRQQAVRLKRVNIERERRGLPAFKMQDLRGTAREKNCSIGDLIKMLEDDPALTPRAGPPPATVDHPPANNPPTFRGKKATNRCAPNSPSGLKANPRPTARPTSCS